MKKTLSLLAIAALLMVGFASAASTAEDMTFTGWVADEACAKDFSKAGNADHKGCATGCLNNGGKVALASEAGFHLLDLSTEKALENLGMEVTVMGTLDEASNTIKVTSISASK